MMRLTRSKADIKKKYIYLSESPMTQHASVYAFLLPCYIRCVRVNVIHYQITELPKTQQQKEQHKAQQNCCQQYWLLKWSNLNLSYLQTHTHTQNYLGIKEGIFIKIDSLKLKRNNSKLNSNVEKEER